MIQKGIFTILFVFNFSQVSFAATEEDSRSLAFVKKVFTEAQPKEHHEVSLNASQMSLSIDEYLGSTFIADIEYGYFLSPTFQLDLTAGYGGFLGDRINGVSSSRLGGGLTLNLGSGEVQEKYFLAYHYTETRVFGPQRFDPRNHSSLSFGKRWKLGSWFAYKPNVKYFFSRSDGNADTMNFNLLVFSAIF